MFCRFKCICCEQWHGLGELSNQDLRTFLKIAMIDPPEPFSKSQWLLIVHAELKRRGVI